MKAADSNGDENLDYEEFLNWLLGKENEWAPIKEAMMSTPDEDACPSKAFGLISFGRDGGSNLKPSDGPRRNSIPCGELTLQFPLFQGIAMKVVDLVMLLPTVPPYPG